MVSEEVDSMKLTDTQRSVYAFIRSEQRRTGSLPTCKAIANEFGWKSVNSAQCHVKALRTKGYIKPAGDAKGRMELPKVVKRVPKGDTP